MPRAQPAARRDPERDRSPDRLPLPPALPAGDADLQGGVSGAGGEDARVRHCLPRRDEESSLMTQITATHTFARSPDPTGEDCAYLDFVPGLKQHWARTLYPKLREQYDDAIRQPG